MVLRTRIVYQVGVPESLSIPFEVSQPIAEALGVFEQHLGTELLAVYLYGSALDGGLKPASDIDLLVIIRGGLSEPERAALILALSELSSPPLLDPALKIAFWRSRSQSLRSCFT